MRIVHEYIRLIDDGVEPDVPRTYVFAGKAAPGYWAAKQIIKLICSVGEVINTDRRARQHMRVVFVPDLRVSLAQLIIPGADLSEQISTAGSEASGTGNMKLAMNGALTIGTLDGANIEMLEAIGAENMFIFGLPVDRVQALRADGSYRPRDVYQHDARVKRVVDACDSRRFSPTEPGLFHWIAESMLDRGDYYFHLADLAPYLEAQERVGKTFSEPAAWTSKAILNVARMGKFSSDRTVAEYASEIWGIRSVR
jgi:starch phosphorylase